MYKELTEEQISQMMPYELTSILYEACVDKLDEACSLIEKKSYFNANKKLQTCSDIIYRLGAGIKYDAGPLADQLDNIYNYCAETLFQANLSKDVSLIKIVRKIINEISEAWCIALEKGTNETTVNKKILAYDSYNY